MIKELEGLMSDEEYDIATNKRTLIASYKADINSICKQLESLNKVKEIMSKQVTELEREYKLKSTDHLWRRLCERVLNLDTKKIEEHFIFNKAVTKQYEMFGDNTYEIDKYFSVVIKGGVAVTILLNDKNNIIDYVKIVMYFIKNFSKTK